MQFENASTEPPADADNDSRITSPTASAALNSLFRLSEDADPAAARTCTARQNLTSALSAGDIEPSAGVSGPIPRPSQLGLQAQSLGGDRAGGLLSRAMQGGAAGTSPQRVRLLHAAAVLRTLIATVHSASCRLHTNGALRSPFGRRACMDLVIALCRS